MKVLLPLIFFGLVFGTMSTLLPAESISPVPSISLVIISLISMIGAIRSYKIVGIMMILLLGIVAIGFESYGIATCYPYGCFSYADLMGYKLADLVPWTVFFAWTPFVLLAWAMSRTFIEGRRRIQFILALVLLVSFDLVLDPGAVHMGLWRFLGSSVYYGVPISNFIGWVLTGFIGLCIIFYWFNKKHTPEELRSMMWSGIFFIAFWSGYNIAVVQWGPAAIGVALLLSFIHLRKT